ncbi:hypothetical protein [Aquimarina brevivitae]|uniref:UDP:flavonoid glycosyltransferase YjiC (YdhE family) n=1 Tax=Aquimarina brevivitae TaxID=323412 RepID=A0A4Q7PG01_9FLAO|nr:hypothetical protein [Aquimarina brevivitae]RZS99433.1 UDP:flavonoid glycosyltransferase YjiC (YdhE family) [Aquimarina brevivitae]
MNILNIPYFAGGLSHLIPLYVLHHKYIKKDKQIKNQFFVSNNLQNFLRHQGVECVSMDYFDGKDSLLFTEDQELMRKYLLTKQEEAFQKVQPDLIIEDTATSSPLIAEKKGIPRISIQRTGIFRSIDKKYRNQLHVHSLQKGGFTDKSDVFTITNNLNSERSINSDSEFLKNYNKPKVKIIPGIPSIECLPYNIADKDSYFYSGPLIVMDKPSKSLSTRLNSFLRINKNKPIVFITTGTVDKTPIASFIKHFVERGYAVITTCNTEINQSYPDSVFFNKLLPLHYICSISDLVFHQCGSGMYHYPIMNGKASLTIGTQCYDREDIAQRLQQLGVSGHIPHPDDNPNYWDIFIEKVNQFEQSRLVDDKMIEKLRIEIENTMSTFDMKEVIDYAIN